MRLSSRSSWLRARIVSALRCAIFLASVTSSCVVLLSGSSSTASAGVIVSQHLEPAEPADFTLSDAEGKTHNLSALRGDWVVVNFWATWCGPCIREMPILQDFSSATADVTVIGVNFEQLRPAELAAALAQLNVDYVNVQVGDTPLLPFEPLLGLPSTFLVAPDGTLVYRHTGEISLNELRKAISEAQRRFAARERG